MVPLSLKQVPLNNTCAAPTIPQVPFGGSDPLIYTI